MSWTLELQSPVSAPRLFKAALLDRHNLAPKLMPGMVVSAGLEGDGGVGSVRQFNFSPGMLPFSFVKERVDSLDVEKFECKQTLIEGGGVGQAFESATTHIKIEPASGGGCVCKVAAMYKALPGVDISGVIAQAKEAVAGNIKATEGYLLANPGAYA